VPAVLASHVVAEVEPVCDRLLVLGQGRVLLHETVVEALGAHRVAPEGALDTPGLVALFPDRAGTLHALVQAASDTPSTRPATMEEIVMGYLSAGRAAPTAGPLTEAATALAVAS